MPNEIYFNKTFQFSAPEPFYKDKESKKYVYIILSILSIIIFSTVLHGNNSNSKPEIIPEAISLEKPPEAQEKVPIENKTEIEEGTEANSEPNSDAENKTESIIENKPEKKEETEIKEPKIQEPIKETVTKNVEQPYSNMLSQNLLSCSSYSKSFEIYRQFYLNHESHDLKFSFDYAQENPISLPSKQCLTEGTKILNFKEISSPRCIEFEEVEDFNSNFDMNIAVLKARPNQGKVDVYIVNKFHIESTQEKNQDNVLLYNRNIRICQVNSNSYKTIQALELKWDFSLSKYFCFKKIKIIN